MGRALSSAWRWYRGRSGKTPIVLGGVVLVVLLGIGGTSSGGSGDPAVTPANGSLSAPSESRPQSSAGTLAAGTIPPYQLLAAEQTSTPNRPRYRVNLVVPAEYGRDQMVAVLSDAAHRVLREQQDAKAMVLFSYGAENTNTPFTKGRAWASSDG